MGVTIGRIALGDPAIKSRIESVVREVAAATPREWLVGVTSHTGTWEIAVEGPRRRRAADAEWQAVTLSGGGMRYTRQLRGRSEQTPEAVQGALRRLLWEDIDFRPGAGDQSAYQPFEHAVWDVLKGSDLPPLTVRLNQWRGEADGLRYVCKVEVDPRFSLGEPPWRWWSPLVSTPEELAASLQDAVHARGPVAPRAQAVVKPRAASNAQLPL